MKKTALLWQCLCGALLGIMLFFLINSGISQKNVQQIVTVDLRGMTNAYIQQLTAEHLTQSQAKVRVKSFSSHLQQVLQQYSAQHHVILMPQAAVIEGAADATTTICKNLPEIQGCK